MKQCATCKQVKSLQEFSKCRSHKDGLASTCKQCASVYRKIWAERNIEYLRHIKRVDYCLKREHYNELNNVRRKNSPDGRKEETRLRQIRHGDQIRQYSRDYKVRHKKQYQAAAKVQSALRSGKLTKPERCAICSSPMNLRAHHNDYDKPLDVLWICESCHRILHNKEVKNEAAIHMAE
jgi:hypothetical protein